MKKITETLFQRMELKMRTKRSLFYIFSVVALLIIIWLGTLNKPSDELLTASNMAQTFSGFLSPDMGCTVIYAANDEVALGGNNEDYINPFTMAWFLPPVDGEFGRVYFGYEGFIWGGGMNDQGLFFDALAVDQPMTVFQGEKLKYDGSLPDKAMKECANVDCVIDIFSH